MTTERGEPTASPWFGAKVEVAMPDVLLLCCSPSDNVGHSAGGGGMCVEMRSDLQHLLLPF